MYLLLRKVFYNGRGTLDLFIQQSSLPQHLKFVVIDKNLLIALNRLLHGALQISMEIRNSGNVDILGTVFLTFQIV